jgi:hypothetical protein
MADEPTRATRLLVEYDGDDLRVTSSQSVRMRVPASDPTYAFQEQSGFWLEVRAADQECLYRKVLHHPMDGELEAPSGDPERPFTMTRAPAKGVFVLVVPELSEGRELVLYASPARDPNSSARAFAAIDLRKPQGEVRKIVAERKK